MEIMPWRSSQMSPISSLQSEMNRMLEDFFTQPFGVPLQRMRSQQQPVMPAIDVREDETSFTVTAELPGIDAKDIEISVQDDVLELRGQKSEERRSEQENVCMVERSYGSFARRIMLPAEVNDEQAEATMNNGVLTLRLPKAGPKAGKKTISVKESGQQQLGQQQPSVQSEKQQQTGQQSRSQPSQQTGQRQQSQPS